MRCSSTHSPSTPGSSGPEKPAFAASTAARARAKSPADSACSASLRPARAISTSTSAPRSRLMLSCGGPAIVAVSSAVPGADHHSQPALGRLRGVGAVRPQEVEQLVAAGARRALEQQAGQYRTPLLVADRVGDVAAVHRHRELPAQPDARRRRPVLVHDRCGGSVSRRLVCVCAPYGETIGSAHSQVKASDQYPRTTGGRHEPRARRPAARRWEEASPGNVHGVARALTAIGPLGTGPRYWLMQLAILARRFIAPYRKARAAELRRLSFVDFARWVLIRNLPAPDGTSRPLKPTYMLFESNFNGGFEEYIDAFSDVLTTAMNILFGAAYNFPGPQPSGPFKDFIRRHDYEAEHFYSAYETTTAPDVGRALTVAEESSRARGRGRLYSRGVRAPLAGLPHERRGVPVSRDRSVLIGGTVAALTVILAIEAGQERRLRKRILEWDPSPFALLPTTTSPASS